MTNATKKNKKKLLFVIDSLEIGGSERSLLSLLSTIDSTKFEIDLQLFKYGGELESLVPSYINVLKPLPFMDYCGKSLFKTISRFNINYFFSRLFFSIKVRIFKQNTAASYSVMRWKIIRKCFDVLSKQYDVAIAYAQNTPTFYVAECVKAENKIAWINEIYQPENNHIPYLEKMYRMYKKICCVSDASLNHFNTVFPTLGYKTVRMFDIKNASVIKELSNVDSNANSEMDFDGIKILTVGRLVPDKGYEIAIEACKKLKEKNANVKWYVVGDGSSKHKIETLIKKNNLDDEFVLLGSRSNPYPYFKHADIYVQTSIQEGFGLTVSEAKIFNIPVVSTNYKAVYDQITNYSNGIISDMTGEAIATGILELINDRNLYNHIKQNLEKEKKDNTEEINVLYSLIEK